MQFHTVLPLGAPIGTNFTNYFIHFDVYGHFYGWQIGTFADLPLILIFDISKKV